MDELVKYLAQSLVNNPEQVAVELKQGEDSTIIELKVAQEDMGKVIGKQGKIAKAIRKIVKAASLKSGVNYVVEIAE